MVVFFGFLIIVGTSLVATNADYGTGQSGPTYPAPAPAPQPVYVPVVVQPPAPLPEYPADHEILFPRRRHHRRSSSSSSSSSKSRSSESHEKHKKCSKCHKIKKSAAGGSFKPEIYYFEYKGCRRAVITCESTSKVKLVTQDGVTLAFGKGIQKVANCNGKKHWKATSKTGDDVFVSELRCVNVNQS